MTRNPWFWKLCVVAVVGLATVTVLPDNAWALGAAWGLVGAVLASGVVGSGLHRVTPESGSGPTAVLTVTHVGQRPVAVIAAVRAQTGQSLDDVRGALAELPARVEVASRAEASRLTARLTRLGAVVEEARRLP